MRASTKAGKGAKGKKGDKGTPQNLSIIELKERAQQKILSI